MRKLDTTDPIDAKLACGGTTKQKWMGKTLNTNAKYDKNGEWDLKFEKDCEIVNAGASALKAGAATLALVAASLY